MRISALILLVVVSFAVPSGHLCAQNFLKDYFKNVPRSYSPDDPWIMGKILRTEVGHGGFFYNCDSEECKRQSPYINWNRQSTECVPSRPVKRTILNQLDEIKQRVRWGSCDESCPQKCSGCSGCNSGGRCVSGLQAIVPSRRMLRAPQRSTHGCSGANNCGCSGCLAKSISSQQPVDAEGPISRGLLAKLKSFGGDQQLMQANESIKLAETQSKHRVDSLAKASHQKTKATNRDASRRLVERLLDKKNDASARVANQLKQQASERERKSRTASKSDDGFRMIR